MAPEQFEAEKNYLAAREIAEGFLKELEAAFAAQLGADCLHSDEYPKLITPAAYEKCAAEAGAYMERVVYGGRGDRSEQKFEPTVIYPVGIDEEIVRGYGRQVTDGSTVKPHLAKAP